MSKAVVSALILILILVGGTFGYVAIEGCSPLDGLYMTMITITTVGFSEVIPLSPAGRLFTIFLIVTGVGFVLYEFTKLTEAVVEGGVRKVFGRINMDKKLAKLRGHYIVCGYGRIGKVICQSLKDNGRQFVIIDNDTDEIKEIAELGYYYLEGEAADDEMLLKAGVRQAQGLIAVVSSDADNVYITLSAKELNPKLFIMARSSGKKGADSKLRRAGANRVISPYFIGGRQMANMILRPTVIDFLDLTVHEDETGLRLEELTVHEHAAFVGQSLMDSGIRQEYDLIVVAIKRKGDNEMLFNPSHQSVIHPGDTLIVLGESENVERLKRAC